MLHDYRPNITALVDVLAQYLNVMDLATVRESVAEAQQRIDRFGKGFGKSK